MCVAADPQQEQETRYAQASIYGPNDPMVRRNNAAIASVQERIDTRNKLLKSEKHPLVAGLYGYENYRAGKLIENLRRGDRPIYDKDGRTVGTRNAYNQLTGRDPELDAQRAARNDEKQQERAAREDLAARQAEAAKKRKEQREQSATTPVDTSRRRSIVYEDQARSSARSRGSGRRSLLG